MWIIGVDPGPEKSGVVVYDSDSHEVLFAGELENNVLLKIFRGQLFEYFDKYLVGGLLAIETIEGMGQIVGKDVFETCIWIGKLIEAWERYTGQEPHRVSRGDEKIVLCGAKTYKDSKTGKRKAVSDALIRQAVIQQFPATGGGKVPQIGTIKQKGPLYEVKGHAWSALAVALTFFNTENPG